MKTILNRIVFLCYNEYRIEGSLMYVNDNNNIGFKLFFMIVLIGGALLVDLFILGGVAIDFDFGEFIDDLLYYDVDHTDCEVQLTHNLSVGTRYRNYIDLGESAQDINELMDEWDIVLEEVEWENIPSKYIIDSCDTTLYYNDEHDVAEYNGMVFDVTDYKEELNEIINEAINSEMRPRLYKVDSNYETTNLEPIYFSDQDVSDLLAYWQQDPKTVSSSFFTVNGKYHFVIGNDVVLLDNTLGIGMYNGNKIEISDNVMDILDNYI